jgi:hypothetical protein
MRLMRLCGKKAINRVSKYQVYYLIKYLISHEI